MDDILNIISSTKILLNLIPRDPIDSKSALVQIVTWRRSGVKPIPEPLLSNFWDAIWRHKAAMC